MRIISIIKDPHIAFYCKNTDMANTRPAEGPVKLYECELKVFVEREDGQIDVFSDIDCFSIIGCKPENLELRPLGLRLTKDLLDRAVQAEIEDGENEYYAKWRMRELFNKYGGIAVTY